MINKSKLHTLNAYNPAQTMQNQIPTPNPDFNRIAATLHHQEPDRVPLAEAAVDYKIMSRFLGREVRDEDVAGQVEFWRQAG